MKPADFPGSFRILHVFLLYFKISDDKNTVKYMNNL